MSGRGGIYTGYDGEDMHGDGSPVESPAESHRGMSPNPDDISAMLAQAAVYGKAAAEHRLAAVCIERDQLREETKRCKDALVEILRSLDGPLTYYAGAAMRELIEMVRNIATEALK